MPASINNISSLDGSVRKVTQIVDNFEQCMAAKPQGTTQGLPSITVITLLNTNSCSIEVITYLMVMSRAYNIII